MWVPKEASDVEQAARRGDLEETTSFDGKLNLPTAKRNIDLAVDVAAMSTEGGSLLYGIGEDENEQLTKLEPIALAGVADRIGQIVATSIVEVPHIEVREHPCEGGPARGYVSVVVPQSARAPHQVVAGGDLRFYGRGAKGNRRLDEGEIARLYDRRHQWSQDRGKLLAEAVAQAPFPSSNDRSYLHGFARPAAPDRATWERAEASAGGRSELQLRLAAVADRTPPHNGYSPSFKGGIHWFRKGADEWMACPNYETDYSRVELARFATEARFNIDGRGHLFYGRAGEERPEGQGELLVLEANIAGTYATFLAMLGELYGLAGYHGHVDIGLFITGLHGAVSSSMGGSGPFGYMGREEYDADDYQRTERVAAGELIDPAPVVVRMLRHLFEATTGRAGFDPLSHPDG